MKIVNLRTFNPKTNKEEQNEYIVASTKTQNILVEQLQNDGYYVAVLGAKELYLDREKVKSFAKDLCKDFEYDLTEEVLKAFEVACLIKRLEK